MRKRQMQFDLFEIDAPDVWLDTTNYDRDEEPTTLAKQDGVGALQFSIARYSGGRVPNPSSEDLLEMALQFGKSHGFGAAFNLTSQTGPLSVAAASYRDSGDFIRVWYVSDGFSFAFVTYICLPGSESSELADYEAIVRSIQFRRKG